MEERNWATLPDHIIVTILLHLELSDRCRSARVCKSWRACFDYPVVWHSFKFVFHSSKDFEYDKCLENHGEYLKSVEIDCKQGEKANRENACQLIRKLGNLKVRRLQRLKIVFSGENPLFYAGQEFIQSLKDLFSSPKVDCSVTSGLKAVDLSKLPIAYGDDLLRCLAENSSDLESLNIQNGSLVCKVSPACISNIVHKCRKLKSLALHYTSVTENILLSLTEGDRLPLEHLSIDCRREEKYGKDISSKTWQELRTKIPCLRVTLAFDQSCPMFKVNAILKAEVPLWTLWLEVQARVVYQVYFAADSYSETLERMSISTTNSVELERALIHLASRCTKLRELYVFQCYVSKEIRDKILELCPGMKKYILKVRETTAL